MKIFFILIVNEKFFVNKNFGLFSRAVKPRRKIG